MAVKSAIDTKRLTLEEFDILKRVRIDLFLFSSFVKVIHPILGKVPFDLYPFQRAVLWQFIRNRFNIVLKFRQAGLTQLIAMFCLWYAMYHNNKTIVIISIKDITAKKVLRRIKFMYRNLPEYLQVPIINGRTGEYGTSSTMEFSNGSTIESIPTTEEAGRSESISLLVIDEAAIVRWADSIWSSAFPTLSCISSKNEILIRSKVKKPRSTRYKYVIEKIPITKLCPKTPGVKDLYSENIQTLTHTGQWKQIMFSQNKGKLETWEVVDCRGKSLECTPEHRLLTPYGWKTTREIIARKLRVIQTDLRVDSLESPPITTPPPIEEYKDIPGLSRYKVSNLGRIVRKTDQGGLVEIKPFLNHRGRLDVTLFRKVPGFSRLQQKKYSVSRLVARTFLGPIPKDHVVDHINCNPTDNYVTNLQIITPSENTRRSYKYTLGTRLSGKVNYKTAGLVLEMHRKNPQLSHEKLREKLKARGIVMNRKSVGNILNRDNVYLSKLKLVRKFKTSIYDINVEGDHSYVLPDSNFINHNTGGRAILNSTPYGIGNFFHKMWVNACAGGNDIVPIRLTWDMHPERDIHWYKQQRAILGTRRTAQEIDGDFLSSGYPVFNLADIRAIEESLAEYIPIDTTKHPLFRDLWKDVNPNMAEYLYLYDEPKPHLRYTIGSDVSSGRSRDYSSFTIMDQFGEEHGCFKGKLPPGQLASMLMYLGRTYNNALLAPESNDIGLATAQKIQEAGYSRLYYSIKLVKKKGESKPAEEKIPGWYTTKKNRPVVIAELEEDVRLGNIIVKDPYFVNEAYTFIYDEMNRPVALGKGRGNEEDELSDDEGYSDDDILGKCITNHTRKTSYKGPIILPH